METAAIQEAMYSMHDHAKTIMQAEDGRAIVIQALVQAKQEEKLLVLRARLYVDGQNYKKNFCFLARIPHHN